MAAIVSSRLFLVNALRCTQTCLRQVATVSCQTSNHIPTTTWEKTPARRSCLLQFTCSLSMGSSKPPKKPLTSYFLFKSEKYPELARQQPNASITELSKQLGQLWRELSSTDKQRYVQVYQAEKLKYEQTLTEEMKQQLTKERISRRQQLVRYRKKQELKKLERPKHPANSYGIFFKERMPSRGNIPPRKYLGMVAEEWKNMSDDQKMPYKEQAVVLRKAYSEKLLVWEASMKEEGHPEYVRGYKPTQVKKTTKTRVKKAKPKKVTKKEAGAKKTVANKQKTVSKKTGDTKKKSNKEKVDEDTTWMREE